MTKRSGFAKLGWKGLVILGIVYLILPIDFIPDVIPLLGWVDDATLMMFIAKMAMQLFLEDRKNKALPVRVKS